MKLTLEQLRRLIEAEVDKMRLPKGPNSRDDAEDKPLSEEPEKLEERASRRTVMRRRIRRV